MRTDRNIAGGMAAVTAVRAAASVTQPLEDGPTELIVEIAPQKHAGKAVMRCLQERSVQAIPTPASKAVQAPTSRPTNTATQTDSLLTGQCTAQQDLDPRPLNAFLQQVMPWCEAITHCNRLLDVYKNQLATLDEEDTGDAAAQEGGRAGSRSTALRVLSSIADVAYTKDCRVASLQWMPGAQTYIASATVPWRKDNASLAGVPIPSHILLWNPKHPLAPMAVLECPYELSVLSVHPYVASLVVGGCNNGLVVVWDISRLWQDVTAKAQGGASRTDEQPTTLKPVHPIALSHIDRSHCMAVADLQWLKGVKVKKDGRMDKTNPLDCTQLASTAADGRILVWDVANMLRRATIKGSQLEGDEWGPTLSLPLNGPDGCPLMPTKLLPLTAGLPAAPATPVDPAAAEPETAGPGSTSPPAGPCGLPAGTPVFVVGSFDGEIMVVDPAATHSVGSDGELSHVLCKYKAHAGPVLTLQASPFLPELVLTVDDVMFAVWDLRALWRLKGPLLLSSWSLVPYTLGAWSPARPGVLYMGRKDGSVDVWDLLDRTDAPVASSALISSAITMLAFPSSEGAVSTDGRTDKQAMAKRNMMMALGSSEGSVHVVEVPRQLRRRLPREADSMSQLMAHQLAHKQDPMFADGSLVAPSPQDPADQAGAGDNTAIAEALKASKTEGSKAPRPGRRSDDKDSARDGDVDADEAEYRTLEKQLLQKLGLPLPAAIEQPLTARNMNA